MKKYNCEMNPAALALVLLLAASAAGGQTYHPADWVNDPYCSNPNYSLTKAGSGSFCFTNNGIQRGSLFANSPVGATLKLSAPGDRLAFTGQVTLAGKVNADGHLQFRVGLYHQGRQTGDTNWLGYMFGNVTGAEANAAHSLFIRNNPNSGNYGAGLYGCAEMPKCEDVRYAPKWGAGTYDFELAVTMLPDNAHKISWNLAGQPPLEYKQSGVFTNTVARTMPPDFDQVGFLAGAAIFESASTNNTITFKHTVVSLNKANEIH